MTPNVHIQPELEYDLATAKKRWESLQPHNIARSVFTQFDFAVCLCEAFSWKLVPVFWRYQGEDALGALFVVRTRWSFAEVVVPPFSPYSFISLSSRIPESERQAYVALLFSSIPGLPDSRTIVLDPVFYPLSQQPDGFQGRPLKTFEISLGDMDQAKSTFSESTRRKIKTNDKEYIFQIESTIVPDLGSLVEDGYTNHGRKAPLPAKELESLAVRAASNVHTKVAALYAKQSGVLEAEIVLLVDEDSAWYWLAGSRRGPAMTVLIAKTLEQMGAEGIATFHFMGANTDGISEFKRRFGGSSIAYPSFSRKSVALRFLDLIGSWKRTILG